MFLLKVIRPKVIPNRKSNWGYRIRFYYWALLKLLSLYRRCAISDTINIGDLQIIHNVRDYWYEQELQRFNIDIAQHIEKRSIPFSTKNKVCRYNIFHRSESLLLFYAGKSYNIKRTNNFVIETDMGGQLKVSSQKDIILRSEFVAKLGKSQQSCEKEVEISSITSRMPVRKPQGKISIKDSVPASSTDVPKQNLEPVKYRGFEENSIF